MTLVRPADAEDEVSDTTEAQEWNFPFEKHLHAVAPALHPQFLTVKTHP